jgi:hypothetical protein
MYTAARCRATSLRRSARESRCARCRETEPTYFVESAFVYVGMDDSPERARARHPRSLVHGAMARTSRPGSTKYCRPQHARDVCGAAPREFVDVGIRHLALGTIHDGSIARSTRRRRAGIKGNARHDQALCAQLLPIPGPAPVPDWLLLQQRDRDSLAAVSSRDAKSHGRALRAC